MRLNSRNMRHRAHAALVAGCLLRAALAIPADLSVWFGAPEIDTCYAPSALPPQGATPSDAGCGIQLASGGVRVPFDADDPSAVFVANGRNQLYLRTFQGSTPCATNKGTCEQTLALQVTSESSDEMALCTHATVLRPAFDEGSFDQPITQQPDPTAAHSPVTVPAGDLGTVFHVIPYALEERRAPPWPKLTMVLVPLLTREMRQMCTAQTNGDCECEAPFEEVKDGAIVVSGGEAVECRHFNVSRLDPIEFEVAVRTEPNLAPLRSELVDNCWYAFKQDHQRSKFDLEMVSAAARPALAVGGAVAATIAAAWRVRR